MDDKDMEYLCKIKNWAEDEYIHWYGGGGIKQDILFLLKLLEDEGVTCRRGD